LVGFGGVSIPGDLGCLRTQVLGHSIPYRRFTSSPNLSSRASTVWEILGRIGGRVLSSWFSGCCSRASLHLADRPRGRCEPSAWRVLPRCSSRSSRVLERLRFDPVGQWLLVESGLADSLQGRRGQSAGTSQTVRAARVARGSSEDVVRTVRVWRCRLGVLLVFNGPSAVWCGPSAWWSRTVRHRASGRPPGLL
jgi:hypothetical protein